MRIWAPRAASRRVQTRAATLRAVTSWLTSERSLPNFSLVLLAV